MRCDVKTDNLQGLSRPVQIVAGKPGMGVGATRESSDRVGIADLRERKPVPQRVLRPGLCRSERRTRRPDHARMVAGLAVVILFLLVGCATTPVTQRKALILVPFEQEEALGIQAYREILGQEKPSHNQAWAQLTRRVGQRIARVSDMPNLNWEFNVFDSKEANAFCLPGGKVGVYGGLMPVALTEAGLAAVIGHEVGHAVARHSGERMSQALLVNLGLQLADVSLQNSQQRNLILAAMGLGAQVGVLLPYSRMQESEADEIGIVYMARAGYDPHEALSLWERFAQLEQERPPEFLSTHPAPRGRLSDLGKLVGSAAQVYQSAPVRYGKGERIPLGQATIGTGAAGQVRKVEKSAGSTAP